MSAPSAHPACLQDIPVTPSCPKASRYPALLSGLSLLLMLNLQQVRAQDTTATAVQRVEGVGLTTNIQSAVKRARTPASTPYAPIQVDGNDAEIAEFDMFVGESRVFPAPGAARIAVGNGKLLTAAALDDKEVILFANGEGTSSLFIWNADGRHQRVKVNIVSGDTSRHAREIAAFLSTIPNAKASIIGANIVVEGDQLSDFDLDKVEMLAKRYPQIVNFTNRVGWEKMIALDVKVVEFPSSALKEAGLKWNGTGGAALGAIWGPARRGQDGPYQLNLQSGSGNSPPITNPGGGPVNIPGGLNVLSLLNMGLNAQLSLLEQEGKVALLAEPQLSARNGSKASFLAGGEIPYAVTTRDGTFVQFKPYGIKVDITPRVDASGVIRASIESEVSSIDRSVTTFAGPALLTRKANTEFNLRDGETLVLAGLLQREVSSDVDKLPVLGDIPILGALFRSRRFQNKETELVVFVTPRIVSSESPSNRDRVARTTERLEQRMGPSPYLSDPLQPGVSFERADQVPPRPVQAMTEAGKKPEKTASRSVLPPDGLLLRVQGKQARLHAQPRATSDVLMTLDPGAVVESGPAAPPLADQGRWTNVRAGSWNGWMLVSQVEAWRPMDANLASLLPAPPRVAQDTRRMDPASLDDAALGAPMRIRSEDLALLNRPDMDAGVVWWARRGQQVHRLDLPPQGPWIAVQYGAGAKSRRGWVQVRSLVPQGIPEPETHP